MPEYTSIESILESLLFAAGEPVSLDRLSFAADEDKRKVEEAVTGLAERYSKENRGIMIVRFNDSYQMCTNRNNASYIKRLVRGSAKKRLTQAQMETLAIIAYKQPVTKPQIEEIRGVNSDHAVNKLIELDLIEETGRLNTVGKPILFSTSEEFLRHFALSNAGELPQLRENIDVLEIEALEEVEKKL